jgi:NAD+ synthase (glutamine-hydrolysing)
MDTLNFNHPARHGFVRVAAALPRVALAQPLVNAQASLELIEQAVTQGASVVALPELGLSGYSCDDLFHQSPLLDASLQALRLVCEGSAKWGLIWVLGMPLRVDEQLFNVAVLGCQGRLLGVVPKTYLPNHGEFYEGRQFASGCQLSRTVLNLLGQEVPVGSQLLFEHQRFPGLRLHVELCEDLWTPIPPSSLAALAGATVMLNLSASNAAVGKAAYREQLVRQQSARCLGAYVYASAGAGESTTDLAWDGHGLIAENGQLLAQSQRFSEEGQCIVADVDLGLIAHERMRLGSFGQSRQVHAQALQGWRRVMVDGPIPALDAPGQLALRRTVHPHPYVPSLPTEREPRCQEVVSIQVQGLVQRLRSSGIQRLVIGVSGGLDSTLALLVSVQALKQLGQPPSQILACTLPGFATSERTRDQALRLMQAVGCEAREIDIRPSCEQMLKDLAHPYAQGEPVYDVTFENVQAGERTNHLFRLANHHGGLVVGTGDLSELALGWCTYGVGDHMSHYNVNASVPKTLVRHLIAWMAEREGSPAPLKGVLQDILDTEISPELVPPDAQGQMQSTQAQVGAYELQDFNLYHTLRYGFAPSKIAYLAGQAWAQQAAQGRPAYDHATIRQALGIFVRRFFQGSQFKRSCVPNGPKVGNGGSLSPRGDWRAPSDASAAVWLADWEQIPQGM